MAKRLIRLTGFVVFLIAACPLRASATLGSDVTTVNEDRAKMQGALMSITRNDRFEVHQLQASNGTTVREYVSSTGTVFAVSWEGPWMPDLRQVLGPYFDAYQRTVPAVRNARRSHGPMTFRSGDLVVQIGGHPRAFVGRAYIERLVPQGMQAQTIR
ncbi:MAG TPA: DUF2844 domain-containing protein [Vicinamibacterales bacterium]